MHEGNETENARKRYKNWFKHYQKKITEKKGIYKFRKFKTRIGIWVKYGTYLKKKIVNNATEICRMSKDTNRSKRDMGLL